MLTAHQRLKILPETEFKREEKRPCCPLHQKARPVPVEQENKWSFDVDRIRIANSLLVWQTEDGSQINMRDINFSRARNTPERYVIALNSIFCAIGRNSLFQPEF